jgi:hypothetical protein
VTSNCTPSNSFSNAGVSRNSSRSSIEKKRAIWLRIRCDG